MMRNDAPPDKPNPAPGAPGGEAVSRSSRTRRAPTVAAKFAALLGETLGGDGADVDDGPSGEVESTSAPQKGVDPEFALEVDLDEAETGKGDRDRDGPTSLSGTNPRVKPLPSMGRAEHVSDDKEGGAAPTAPTSRDTSAEGRGRVIAFRPFARASLSGIATLFDTEGIDLWFDTALGAVVLRTPPPWDLSGDYPRPVKAADELRATRWVATNHHDEVGPVVVRDALRLAAMNPTRQFDSVAEAVRAAAGVWDQTPRLEAELADYLGLDDGTPETRAKVANWWIASVQRMVTPGTRLEDVLLVEEARELRATTQALHSLLPAPLVVDAGLDFDCRFLAAPRRLVGCGLAIVGDVAHHSVRELETLVAFAARGGDGDDLPPRHGGFALVSSDRRAEHIPARCVPVTAVRAPTRLVEPAVVYAWLAEALVRSEAYVPTHRTSLYRDDEDPWESPVITYLQATIFAMISTNELLIKCLKVPIDRREKRHHARLAAILTKHRFSKGRAILSQDGAMPFLETPEVRAALIRNPRRENRVRVWIPPADFYSGGGVET